MAPLRIMAFDYCDISVLTRKKNIEFQVAYRTHMG